MIKMGLDFDEDSILRRLDQTSPDALLKSIATELARLAQANNQLYSRLAAMESLQRIADRIAAGDRTEISDEYPSRININADNATLDSFGFYKLEYSGRGRPFRWSGPDPQFSFVFFIDRKSPVHFELEFGKIYADAPVEELTAYADGEPIELDVQGQLDSYRARGVLPPRRNLGGSVLTFVCPKMESPKTRGFGDSRLLGVLFLTLSVGGAGPSSGQSKGEPAKAVETMEEEKLSMASVGLLAPKGAVGQSEPAAPIEPSHDALLAESLSEDTQTPELIDESELKDFSVEMHPLAASLED